MQIKPIRSRLAKVFTVLVGLAFFEVILQGFLFSGWYSRGDSTYLDLHRVAEDHAAFAP